MNQQVMMRKLMKMKEEMEQTQKEIDNTEFVQSSSGIVTVTVLGTREIKSVEISPDFELESDEDREMLSDLIVAACNNAYREIDKVTEQKMAKYSALTGGLGGLF